MSESRPARHEGQARPLVQMTGIVEKSAAIRALDGVDLQVLPGELHCLHGIPAGSRELDPVKGLSVAEKLCLGAVQAGAVTASWQDSPASGETAPSASPSAAASAAETPYQPSSTIERTYAMPGIAVLAVPRPPGESSPGRMTDIGTGR